MWGEAIIDLIENGREEDDRNITLLVGNEENTKKFILSRSVVRLSSEVFEALLSNDPGPHNSYEIPDVEPHVFHHVVKYMFLHSEWRFNGNLEDACSLIRAAEAYKLDELVHIICKQISDLNFEDNRLIQVQNASYIFNVLRNTVCGEEKIWEPVLNYICKNADAVFRQESIFGMSSDALVEILREDSLEIRTELDVFKTVLKWGMSNLQKQSKRCSMENLRQILEWPLRFIRFPNMKEFEFRNYVLPTDILNPQQEKSLLDWWASSTTVQKGDSSNLMFSSKPRMYLLAKKIDDENEPMQSAESPLDLTRAELFQARFKSECENSNLNLAVTELRQELNEKSAVLDSFKNKFRKELQFSLVDLMKLLKEEVGGAKADLAAQMQALESKIYAEAEKAKAELVSATQELREELSKGLSQQDLFLIDAWKVFINETEGTAQEFMNHEADKYACAVLLKNSTSYSMVEAASHFYHLSPTRCYAEMPVEVQPSQVATFGFTENAYGTCGLFSYRLGERRLVVSFYVYSNNHNEFSVGIVPASTPLDDQLYKGMRFADWTEKMDRKKVTCHAPHLTGKVEFGHVTAKATMKSAKKSLLTILIFTEL